jgi:Asp-tRNA(Asn)/Glu-tRNA(Gln) amidotransferase A subunit family amidase
MLSFEDYVAADAIAWAERVRKGEVSQLELIEAAIARAEAVNPQINAIAAPVFERARDAAKAGLTGPLAGVPWAMKDMYQTVEGVPLTNGSRAFKGVVGQSDAELTRRYKAAGLNIMATSTAPEYALAAATESTLYGQTKNPWDLTRTSGGSSGGASALVAAGVMPAAHATDGGGSIRGPASCTGLFGLKPSRGRVPVAVGRTEGWNGCSTTHAVTRSVRDSALILDLSHGPELGSRYVAPPPKGTYLEAASRDPGKLRIAVHFQTRSVNKAEPDCVAAVESAAKLCEELGHTVERIAPPIDFDALAQAFGIGVLTALAVAVKDRAHALGRPDINDLLEQTTVEYCAYAEQMTAQMVMNSNNIFMTAALRMAEFQQTYDVILTPTMGQPPVPLGQASMTGSAAHFDAGTGPFSCYTSIYNCTGQPAMTVPLHWAGILPIGVQFAGRIGEEELLFSLAHQLEQARPWFDRRPAL